MLNENKDKLKELTIPFALVNNKIKTVNEINRYDEAYCLECGERLVLKNGDIKIKHLAHNHNSSCVYKDEKEYIRKGNGESYEHKYAKEFIKDNLTYFRQYSDQIIIKDGEFKLGGYTDLKINSIEVEYRGLQNELKLQRAYIPDLLIRTDNTLIALEIYKSNKKDIGDITELLIGKNISVYEIDINNISLININNVFKNMKLIFSNLKVEYDKVINSIQNIIVEHHNLKEDFNLLQIGFWELEDLKSELEAQNNKLKSENDNLNSMNHKLVNENDKIKRFAKFNNIYDKVRRLEYQVESANKTINKYFQKEVENRKCWTKCVKDWYSNDINSILNHHIKLYDKNSIEYKLLNKFRTHYNGTVGVYGSLGGDDKLKYIATVGKDFKEALQYLGTDNDKFKQVVGIYQEECII